MSRHYRQQRKRARIHRLWAKAWAELLAQYCKDGPVVLPANFKVTIIGPKLKPPPQPPAIITGRVYSWESCELTMGGQTIPIESIQSIEYDL